MAKVNQTLVVADEVIMNKIYMIRGQRVMIDRDLAQLYGVETKQLKRQVRRNIDRFPEDFMFVMSKKEFENWRSQFGTSNSADKMGLRYSPYVFTEQGVVMLSSVLNSQTAIEVNIRIIRVFSKMREMLLTHKDILLKLEQIERKMMKQDGRMKKNEDDIQMIFEALKELLNPPQELRRRIGFRISNQE